MGAIAESDSEPTAKPKARKPLSEVVETSIGFEVSNLGNTPASISELTFRVQLKEGWSIPTGVDASRKDAAEYQFKNIGYLGPKDTLPRRFSITMVVTDAAASSYAEQLGRLTLAPNGRSGPITVKGQLKYTDVFNNPEMLVWCWIQDIDSPYPLACPSS